MPRLQEAKTHRSELYFPITPAYSQRSRSLDSKRCRLIVRYKIIQTFEDDDHFFCLLSNIKMYFKSYTVLHVFNFLCIFGRGLTFMCTFACTCLSVESYQNSKITSDFKKSKTKLCSMVFQGIVLNKFDFVTFTNGSSSLNNDMV